MPKPLCITHIDKMTVPIGDDELAHVIALPEQDYATLKQDFKLATHLSAIDALPLSGAAGVVLYTNSMQDALLAAAYVLRKRESDAALAKGASADNTSDDDEGEEWVFGEPRLQFYQNGRLEFVPVIATQELTYGLRVDMPRGGMPRNLGLMHAEESSRRRPYWLRGDMPLVVIGHWGNLTREALKRARQFVVYIVTGNGNHPSADISQRFVSSLQTAFFELDYEHCKLGSPSERYLTQVLEGVANQQGCTLARDINRRKLVESLKNYLGKQFEGGRSFSTLIKKALRRKTNPGNVLRAKDIDRAVPLLGSSPAHTGAQKEAQQGLAQLVGLEQVKQQLTQVVDRMLFEAARSQRGIKTSRSHMAAVFMGNPGTAKTTAARIFGQMLCEAGVLESSKFVEASRKDIIAQYVGWTAPQVASLFESAKGGTLFIDEAYSLSGKEQDGGFAEEALAEIVLQMENNPGTLVIFAGYPGPMREFVRNANPGLKSRLTHIFEFPDYSPAEMFAIFDGMREQEGYQFEDAQKANEIVHELLAELPAADNGNGRLMRTLLKTAVGFMAARSNHEYITLTTADLQSAARQLAASSVLLASQKTNRIGFAG